MDLDKEELKKAKERLNNLGKSIQANCEGKSNMAISIETLLNKLNELEKDNKYLREYIGNQGMISDYIKWKRSKSESRRSN